MSSFMLAVPVIYEKYDRLSRLARLMKELRVAFILAGASTVFALLIACVCCSLESRFKVDVRNNGVGSL
jgi:hypothetical protein